MDLTDLDLGGDNLAVSRRTVPRSHMELLSNFSATWGRAEGPSFGIHCSKCGQDVTAHNGITDRVLSVHCGCQEFSSEPFGLV